MSWETIVAAKRASLLNLIPSEWRLNLKEVPPTSRLRDFGIYITRFLDPRELQITNASSSAILANIRSVEWSAVEVTRAFCHRSAIAHQLVREPMISGIDTHVFLLISLQTNCLSEIAFVSAEQRARELDEHLLRTGQLIGPLHGLPVSMKDRFNIEGLESACGYVSWLGKTKDAESEGVLVKALRRTGAIFFVKTNVPMSMLVRELASLVILWIPA